MTRSVRCRSVIIFPKGAESYTSTLLSKQLYEKAPHLTFHLTCSSHFFLNRTLQSIQKTEYKNCHYISSFFPFSSSRFSSQFAFSWMCYRLVVASDQNTTWLFCRPPRGRWSCGSWSSRTGSTATLSKCCCTTCHLLSPRDYSHYICPYLSTVCHFISSSGKWKLARAAFILRQRGIFVSDTITRKMMNAESPMVYWWGWVLLLLAPLPASCRALLVCFSSY